MGLSTARIMKYLGIMAAFSGLGIRVYNWLIGSQAPSSPGGEEMTGIELVELGPVVEEAINTGLISAKIPARVQVTVIPLD